MRTFFLLLSLFVVGCTSSRGLEHQDHARKVLFVGNSLTYVGNVPAIYSALARASGRSGTSDMIVRGGATLTERVADGSVARALAQGEYATLVLQERGGDLIGAFGPDSSVQSRQAIRHLAALAEQNGVKVVLLGTYQADPPASRRLVEEESRIAAEEGVSYVEVSETLQVLRRAQPELAWLGPDGMHPGRDLALLNGLLIYQTIHGRLPAAEPLTVKAPIYGAASGLNETLRASDAPAPRPDTPVEIHYPGVTIGTLIDLVERDRAGG